MKTFEEIIAKYAADTFCRFRIEVESSGAKVAHILDLNPKNGSVYFSIYESGDFYTSGFAGDEKTLEALVSVYREIREMREQR